MDRRLRNRIILFLALAAVAAVILVRLSGRQMKRGVTFTLPALLSGLWVLLAMTEVLNHYDLDEIQALAAAVLPKPPRPNSG